MDDSFSRALAQLKGFSGFRPTAIPSREALGTADLRLFEAIFSSGGDERIAIDPATGRNRYGVTAGCAADEVWLSSSTANAVSPRGYDAALAALQTLLATSGTPSIAEWFDRIRARLLNLFGTPGAGVILSASGTEAELITGVLAGNLMQRPLANLVVAPTETGSGVPLAALGRHFLGSAPFAAVVERGQLLQGVLRPDTEIEAIAIRDQAGAALSADRIDAAVAAGVETAIAQGRDVLVHVLDCSKTNRGGPRRALASALLRKFGERVLVVVDSCQLRCSPEQIRADLGDGFMVMITGSKFAGGPPFAGALLLPPAILDRLRTLTLPEGLFAYSTSEDWPPLLRSRLSAPLTMSANIGLGLRWEAALAELEALFSLDLDLRERVVGRFADVVRQHVRACANLELVDETWSEADLARQTIFPIVTRGTGGQPVSAETLHRGLRQPLLGDQVDTRGRVYHVGQPVAVGQHSALRVCLSAPHITAVGEAVRGGQEFDDAFAPLASDLNALFLKWLSISSHGGQNAGEQLTA